MLFCGGDNNIQIYADTKNLGTIYRANGLVEDNLVIEANNQLLLVSAQTATSVYCKKPLTTGATDINWRGLIINTIDRADANLMNVVLLSSANGPTMSMYAGKMIGANTAAPTTRANFMSIT